MRTIKVPADNNEELSIVEVDTVYPGLKELLNGWVERVGTQIREGNDRLCFVVNEEGILKNLPYNYRASQLYPGRIHGDAYFMLEGMVMQAEGYEEPDFKSLPDDFGVTDLERLLELDVTP